MPNVDVSRITNALTTVFADRITAQMNRSVVLLQLLPYSEGSGKNMSWDVEFKNSGEVTDSTLNEGADVVTYQDDDIAPAVLQWGNYSEAFALTGKARAVAATAGNPSELVDLFGQKIERAVRRLCKNIGRDIYTGTGATNYIYGMFGGATLTSAAPLSNAGIYAGVNRATYADWQCNVQANGGVNRALTFDVMRQARRAVYEKCGEMPDMIVCDANQHEKYGSLFGNERRYVQEVTIRGQKIVLDGGYRALEFDGIPVIADVNCPANSMLFLNSNYIKMRQLRDTSDAINQGRGMLGLHGMAEEQFGSANTALKARLNPLAVTGDAIKFQLVLYPQLQFERCNTHCIITDLV
jgi:hypothetical protein